MANYLDGMDGGKHSSFNTESKAKIKIHYYDIHVNNSVDSYSIFAPIEVRELPLSDDDIVDRAFKAKLFLDPDDSMFVDNVTRITKKEYFKAIN